MGLSLVTAPAIEPVTLAEAKAHLRVADNVDDGLIHSHIISARHFVENATRRRLITQTVDQTIDFCWPYETANWREYTIWRDTRLRIVLDVSPVASVSSISYVDGSGATQTLDSSLYVLRTDRAMCFIEPAYGATWPSVREQTAAITVRYVAGYGATPGLVPAPLRHAILMHVEYLYDRDPKTEKSLMGARDSLMDQFIVRSVA